MCRHKQEHRPFALLGKRRIGGNLLRCRTEFFDVRDREARGDNVIERRRERAVILDDAGREPLRRARPFGEVAVDRPGVVALVGPVVVNVLVVRVSGKALLARSLRKRRPGYDDYVERTPAFFPRPPS